MIASFLVSLVDFSRRFCLAIVLIAGIASIAMGVYVAGHIKINTDINQLLSDNLEWRKREKALEAAFPQKTDTIIVVIDGATADQAEKATDALVNRLQALPENFTSISRPDALPLFRSKGLLYLSQDELGGALEQIAQAQPMIGAMVSDPSLRGFFATIALMMQGMQTGSVDPAQFQSPLQAITETMQGVLRGDDKARLDWQKMMPAAESPTMARELRKFIIVKPILDYTALQPGEKPTALIRQALSDLGLSKKNGVKVRLTGSVPLNDEEFASVADGAGVATLVSGILVLVLLFVAMRSWRIVLPIGLTLSVGLVASTAFATFAVGSLNLISVAFAVMFIGIAVDFGIQFGVRYRDQHHQQPDHAQALRKTAAVIALPLAMAAGSTALGFLAFIPTDYRGVSELGEIAGAGMVIAFILNLTLLPALMTLTKPPAEVESVGYTALAPLNAFLNNRGKVILPFILVLVLAGLGVATQLRFDFDPLDLKNPKSESVSTMFEAMQDPESDAYAAQILAPSLEEARSRASALRSLPQVDHVMTLDSFLPEDQDKKLAMIADTMTLLAPSFALHPLPAPKDGDNLAALKKIATLLHQAGAQMPEAKALADTIDNLVERSSSSLLQRMTDSIVRPMQEKISETQALSHVTAVKPADIPAELKRNWVTSDGNALIEIIPKRGATGNPRDPKMLNAFIDAVQKIAPDVSGTPVSIRESSRTIISAFVHAGIYGVGAIALLSFLILRNLRDVALMLVPLLVAGVLTLATITLIDLPLNYANIIALPLLLSLGVSYAVYFVFYARTGEKNFLQSSMARAVLFSAATVLVAFGSLCLSAHPGTRSMGELLTLSLVYSLICTFLILPVLLGLHKKDTQS